MVEEQRKKAKICAFQKQVLFYFCITIYMAAAHIQLYERRRKQAKKNEIQYWDEITPQYMSEESTVEDDEV